MRFGVDELYQRTIYLVKYLYANARIPHSQAPDRSDPCYPRFDPNFTDFGVGGCHLLDNARITDLVPTIFTLYKFRTMCSPSRMDDVPLPDSRRMTRLGRFLRSTSLDELPELFNILKGDMSLVGPRPLLIAYLNRYSTEQARRHDVMPGLTGWAQVNGRNALSWEDKFQLDLWYVDHWSVWLDIKILFLTFWKVIQREGITPVGEVDVEEFKGN
jgi:sugar transferase EpsL